MLSLKNLLIIIDALGNRGPFPDTLTKNLAGVPLIKRAIILARKLTYAQNIFVISTSEEVELISEREGVKTTSAEALYSMFKSLKKETKWPLYLLLFGVWDLMIGFAYLLFSYFAISQVTMIIANALFITATYLTFLSFSVAKKLELSKRN